MFNSVSCDIDFKPGTLSITSKRLWRFYLASHEILRRVKVRGEHLRIWLGHATSLFRIAPFALAIFYL